MQAFDYREQWIWHWYDFVRFYPDFDHDFENFDQRALALLFYAESRREVDLGPDAEV